MILGLGSCEFALPVPSRINMSPVRLLTHLKYNPSHEFVHSGRWKEGSISLVHCPPVQHELRHRDPVVICAHRKMNFCYTYSDHLEP